MINDKKRIVWLDIAKAYGMILVFYGHFIEQVATIKGNISEEFMQFKFIYSFHMPLFFVLAGYVSKTNTDISFKRYFKLKFMTRIIPMFFFNIINAIFLLIWKHSSVDIVFYAKGFAKMIISGTPFFNAVTWFLVCLFSVEVIHYFVGKYATTIQKIVIIASCFFATGWTINYFLELKGIPARNFWYVKESIFAYSLYLLGIIFSKFNLFSQKISLSKRLIAMVTSLVVVSFTFQLNNDFFTFHDPVVVMASSSHGNPILFLLTSISGVIFIVMLSKLSLPTKSLSYISKNSIIFLGCNGLIYNFNSRIAHLVILYFSKFGTLSFLIYLGVILVELLICVPFVYVINKWFPKLIGKKNENNDKRNRINFMT